MFAASVYHAGLGKPRRGGMFACYKYTAPTGLGGGACKPAATNMPPLRGLVGIP
ncbi:hypothetical protein [Desulfonema magnum]|uniref:Uncharacterized protein n=1 Tax=Desulfonema magnum TaxID=45655 RepID=A0A975BRR7_9BACT|nr:hypothetical protein [Desulfonema magnum]QTA90398.1 Uncharacterized protein dnm_064590 [Desulfonema magnum]